MILENIHKNYGNKSVLTNINMEVEPHKITALIGPSVSGKTTLLKIIAGIIEQHQGKIKNEFKSTSMYINTSLYGNMTTRENLYHSALLYNIPKANLQIKEFLRLFNISNYSNIKVKKLTLEVRKMISLAITFLKPAELVVLDEPFKYLSITYKNHLQNFLMNNDFLNKQTLVFCSYDLLSVLKTTNEVYFLKEGKIADQISCSDLNNIEDELFKRHKIIFGS